MPPLIDHAAKEIALRHWALPECLHVPIAAFDEVAIRDHIGEVQQVLIDASQRKALLVTIAAPLTIDPLLPICEHPNAGVLHARRQVWVHIALESYRRAYRVAFPDEDITGMVLSHAMNRRTAALKGFEYVRLTPVSRGANSSSSHTEKWAVALHGQSAQAGKPRRGPPYIQYADLSDLMLMLDFKLGGGLMDTVNEGQKLVRRSTTDL